MFDASTRRRFLLSATAGTVPVVSGCSGLFSESEDEPSGPDAGTDSYGILLRNETQKTHTVRIEVAQPFEDETLFEETVDVEGEQSREWEQVVTESKEWAVTGELIGADTPDRFRSDTFWITPGSDGAPAVENVQVVVRRAGEGNGTLLLNVTDDSG